MKKFEEKLVEMRSGSTFGKLPNEICHLIGEEIEYEDTIRALTLVSKCCYAVFNPFLYAVADESMLETLGLSEKDRLPLTGPHPASFIRKISLKNSTESYEQMVEKSAVRVDAFRTQITSALQNIMIHATAPLSYFDFFSPLISLSEAFGDAKDMSRFGSLKDLKVACPFSQKNFDHSLLIFKTMCSGSLISLTLSLKLPGLFSESQSLSLAKVLEQISGCSKLVKLNITLLGHESYGLGIVTPIQDVWDKTTFTFPSLKVFSLVSEVILSDGIEFERFLQRHPSLKRLRYSDTLKLKAGLRLNLPNLNAFDGSLSNFHALSRDGRSRSIDLLVLNVNTIGESQDGELLLVNALKGVRRTLHKLVLHNHRCMPGIAYLFDGMSLMDIGAITAVCQNLTHFECELDGEATMNFFENFLGSYSLAFRSLSQLEHLKLVMFSVQGSDALSDPEWHRKPNSDFVLTLLCCHNALKTVQLCTYRKTYHPDRYLSRFCFTREGLDLEEVPACDFKDVFKQLIDDFDAL